MLFGTVGRLDFSSCGALDLTRSVMFVLVFKQLGQPACALKLGWTKHLPQTGRTAAQQETKATALRT